ncbi:uncharacterized protein LOC128388245 isoform X2 [Panonychus citri]|uniref:uncharacterized protein LOC128388245 isoform X2 n=1 Tax=Panonychus citri TaxID=50023 RepID=UPI002307548F|nr:uncharacterized protein LOC128388245 isoform X2 [Panonychus citri]
MCDFNAGHQCFCSLIFKRPHPVALCPFVCTKVMNILDNPRSMEWTPQCFFRLYNLYLSLKYNGAVYQEYMWRSYDDVDSMVAIWREKGSHFNDNQSIDNLINQVDNLRLNGQPSQEFPSFSLNLSQKRLCEIFYKRSSSVPFDLSLLATLFSYLEDNLDHSWSSVAAITAYNQHCEHIESESYNDQYHKKRLNDLSYSLPIKSE